MKRWYMIIDVAKCENCNNCFLACKDEHCGNDWPGYAAAQPLHGQRWMNIRRRERGRFPLIDVAYRPSPCMHCDDPPCLKAARRGAVVKRSDGIVLIDPRKAAGQEDLVRACPYGAIWWNEEQQIPQKCTFCAHLLDAGWKTPRCVQACPTGALAVHRVEDGAMAKLVGEQKLEVLDPAKAATRPRVYYRNLHRFRAAFIAGALARGDGKYSECAAGTTVRLIRQGEIVGRTLSAAFGEFKFDGLARGSGTYTLEIDCGEPTPREIEVALDGTASSGVGTIWL